MFFFRPAIPIVPIAIGIGIRPTEVDLLIGDPTKACTKLGWKCKYDLSALVKEMMQSDVKLMQKDQYLKDGGYTTLNYFE